MEHLVVPNKREGAIKWTWIKGKNEFKIGGELASKYKSFTTNYVILNTLLNGELQNFDIVKKIEMIKAHYNVNLPRHIAVYIDYIENLESYVSLKSLTKENVHIDDVKETYLIFLEEYFDHKTQYVITETIVDVFKKAFSNIMG